MGGLRARCVSPVGGASAPISRCGRGFNSDFPPTSSIPFQPIDEPPPPTQLLDKTRICAETRESLRHDNEATSNGIMLDTCVFG